MTISTLTFLNHRFHLRLARYFFVIFGMCLLLFEAKLLRKLDMLTYCFCCSPCAVLRIFATGHTMPLRKSHHLYGTRTMWLLEFLVVRVRGLNKWKMKFSSPAPSPKKEISLRVKPVNSNSNSASILHSIQGWHLQVPRTSRRHTKDTLDQIPMSFFELISAGCLLLFCSSPCCNLLRSRLSRGKITRCLLSRICLPFMVISLHGVNFPWWF